MPHGRPVSFSVRHFSLFLEKKPPSQQDAESQRHKENIKAI